MNNMKKVLAAVLAITLVLGTMGFSVSAATYTDVADDATYAEAVDILSALGLLAGYPDGTFGPDNTITRAEFATVICRALGLETAAEGSKGPTDFADVAADHYASGYINMATRQGIIVGYGDGNFGPDDPVTYEQAVKMIVAAMGYTPRANISGGYPSGYLAIAAMKGIIDNVVGTNGQPATRAMVAQMVYDALPVPLMQQTGGFGGFNATYEEVAGTSILTTYLRVTKNEGVVTNTDYTNVTKEPADRTLTVTPISATTNLAAGTPATMVMGEIDATDYIGRYVVTYSKAVQGRETLVAIADKANKNQILELDDVSLIAGKKLDAGNNNVIEYYPEENADAVKAYLVDDASLVGVYNGAVAQGIVDQKLVANVAGDIALTSGSVSLIDYNNDGKYEYVFIEEGVDTVVAETPGARGRISDLNNNASLVLDPTDQTTRFTLTLDGQEIQPTDLQKYDVVTTYETIGGAVKRCIVTRGNVVSGTISGTVSSNNLEYTIRTDAGSENYAFSPSINVSFELGTEATFYLNADDVVVYIDTANTVVPANYGFVVNSKVVGALNSAAGFTIVKADGSSQDFTSASNITLRYMDGGSEVRESIATEDYDAYASYFNQKLVSYKLNSDGAIREISALSSDWSSMRYIKPDASYMMLGQYQINNSAPVFAVPSTTLSGISASDVTVSDANVFSPNVYYDVQTIVSNGQIVAILAAEVTALVPNDARLFVVKDVGSSLDADGNDVKVFTGMYANEYEFTSISTVATTDLDSKVRLLNGGNDFMSDASSSDPLYNGVFFESNVNSNAIVPGSVITFATNANGEITAAKILYSPTAKNVDLTANALWAGILGDKDTDESVSDALGTDTEGYIFGEVYRKDGNVINIGAIGAADREAGLENAIVLSLNSNVKVATINYETNGIRGDEGFGAIDAFPNGENGRGSVVLAKIVDGVCQDIIVLNNF